ncbi:hypothetical protein BIFLAC_05812 [Bifidobacterium animalis subsp. lactis HN019]|nr:hypothetical protein Balac_1541 [Bifidobacterium animalis subsp. lactis Bl-04]ACS48449.1 hypothetical protein Balat_1541 [Bifidobacterium animalis subsp. lactis DSM 10140]ADG34078.1 hypothetical protein BalV_1490 [Bifidobacterium animalis subsp. lactis V9]EDT88570.1 hypothetical protein BIFLAC_05812 [Bifidobacterium animalis subsp. lactis HN019]EHN17157.1 hypothetical protein FEM_15937 [Bifidobacterium animalis subsp. lactis BS 01]
MPFAHIYATGMASMHTGNGRRHIGAAQTCIRTDA